MLLEILIENTKRKKKRFKTEYCILKLFNILQSITEISLLSKIFIFYIID